MPNFSTNVISDLVNNVIPNLPSKPFVFVRREGTAIYYKSTDPQIAFTDRAAFPTDGERVIPNEFEAQDYLRENVSGYEPPAPEGRANGGITNDGTGQSPNSLIKQPTDPRLIYGNASDRVIYSFSADEVKPLVEGFILPEDASDTQQKGKLVSAQNLPEDDIMRRNGVMAFGGVPALMNPNAYIGFQQFRASKDSNYYARLIDQENQPRWYEVEQANQQKTHRYKSPTVTEIVAWSQELDNVNRKPYRFQDFAYCKYWQLVPNNYLITLRRFPYPTSDNLESEGENNPRNDKPTPPDKLRPIAQAVTWLGETTGNKISTILGPIETGLKWKDLNAAVNVATPGSPADAGSGPLPGIASFVGLIAGDYGQSKNATNGQAPPDPYEDGPWNNKIIGHVNVIDSVKARERGLVFSHKMELTFEYVARSIGGVNTKAAMLDIMSNLLMLTTSSATFWGGANRFRPGAPGNTSPFLGGPAGRAAWMRGDVDGFLNAVASQFERAASAISDFMASAMQDPLQALQNLTASGMQIHMKNTTQKGGFASGIKAILTGEPTGEWHLSVGNPFNPMMMIGNLVCTGCKFEFNEELGPDDFPTELKATITLEHGRPRDRDAIESMFNGGGGRLYSLPPGYEKSWSSSAQSNVDPYARGNSGTSYNGPLGAGGGPGPGGGTNMTVGRNGEGNTGTGDPTPRGGRTSRGVIFGDPSDFDRGVNAYLGVSQRVYSEFAAKYGIGYNKKTS